MGSANDQVEPIVDHLREQRIIAIEIFSETVAAQFMPSPIVPLLEIVPFGVESHGICDMFTAAGGKAGAIFGQKIHALVFDQYDAAMMRPCFQQNRA
ncbi:hypothetical protein AQ768_02660 [Burkholderia pseudomallei]|nr:hypothetical protein AQ768_02660 [Burkholderia pseudomallei]